MTNMESAAGPALAGADWLNLLLVGLLAAATRLYRLGDASFWADEVFTLKFASLPWSTLWVTPYDASPPLYYSTIRLLLDGGTGEWWIRLPSAVAGTLTVVFAYLAVKRMADARAALAAALLLALSVVNIEYSQEARAYALLGMWIAVSFFGLATLEAQSRGGGSVDSFGAFLSRGGIIFGVGTLAALYSHNVAAFYWIGAQCFFLAWWISRCQLSRRVLLYWFVVNALVLLLWSPWLLATFDYIDTGSFAWLRQYEFAQALQVWRNVHGVETGYAVDLFIDAVAFLLAAMGLFALRRNLPLAVGLMAMLLVSSLGVWAYGFVGDPVFMRRTIVWGSMFTLMLVGVAIARLPRLTGGALLLFLVGANAVAVYNYDHYHRAENTDWRSPAALFNEQGKADDIFLFRTTWHAPGFLHYLAPGQAERRVLGWSCTTRQPLFGRVDEGEHFSRIAWTESDPGWANGDITSSNVWVIDSLCHDKMSIELSDNWLGQNWIKASSHGFKGVTLHRWVARRGAAR